MANVKFKPTRTFWFERVATEDDDTEFKVQIKLPSMVDMIGLEETQDQLKVIRKGILAWSGIEFEDGSLVPVNEDTKEMVFDLLLQYPEVLEKVTESLKGINSKN